MQTIPGGIATREMNAALNKYADEAHNTAKAKGFWGEKSNRHQKQALMLVISKLCEALEQHRSKQPKVADLASFAQYTPMAITVDETYAKLFKANFEVYVKDSVEDELADVMIRLFDFARGYGIAIDIERFSISPGLVMEDNFAAQLWIVSGTLHQFPFYQLNNDTKFIQEQTLNIAMLNVMYIAHQNKMELQKHIELKMSYNSMRDHLNGKKY